MEMETGCVLMAANVYPYLIYMMARAVVYTEINDGVMHRERLIDAERI